MTTITQSNKKVKEKLNNQVPIRVYRQEESHMVNSDTAVNIIKGVMEIPLDAYGVQPGIEAIKILSLENPENRELVYAGHGLEIRKGDRISVLYPNGRRLKLGPLTYEQLVLDRE